MLDRVSSQTPFEAGLSGSFSDHNRQGAWASKQGTNAYCWELAMGETHATGDSRHQAPTMSPAPTSTIVVNTGSTKGPRGGVYSSSLPNH